MSNETLRTIMERRSITRFLPSEPDDGVLDQILEAGRWAPSWINVQPWSFIVVTDKDLKHRIGEISSRKTAFAKGKWMEDAAAILVVIVNPDLDPYHYVEDAAIAAQNMALAAFSLGYGSYYLGIYESKKETDTAEDEIKKLLQIPEKMRVIVILPIGIPETTKESSRTELRKIVHFNLYGQTKK